MSTENASPEKTPPESSGGSGTDERIQNVQKQVTDLQNALQATRQTRNLLVLALLAVLGITGGLFYNLANRLQDAAYQEALGAAAQKYLDQNTAEYMKEVQLLVDHVGPNLSDAFMDQVKKDTPLYTQAIDKQRQLLMDNLEERLALTLDEHYEETLKNYEAIIVQEFPAAEDDTTRRRITENFRAALNEMVKEYYIEEFRTELQALYDAWDGFPIADTPDEGDLALEDQLVGTLLNLVSLKLSSSGTDVAAVTAPASDTATPGGTTPDDVPDATSASEAPEESVTPAPDGDDPPETDAPDEGDDASAPTDSDTSEEPEPSDSDAPTPSDSSDSAA